MVCTALALVAFLVLPGDVCLEQLWAEGARPPAPGHYVDGAPVVLATADGERQATLAIGVQPPARAAIPPPKTRPPARKASQARP